MGIYIEVVFEVTEPSLSEMLSAELIIEGATGLEENSDKLIAYFEEHGFNESAIVEIGKKHNLLWSFNRVEERNWNAEWESSFNPIVIDDYLTIRASFHKKLSNTMHEIIITPKMSFGTGHHATTYLMVERMKGIEFRNKTVFDFGTGTGILAILAEKAGAQKIVAADYDEWSVENAAENISANGCEKIEVLLTDKVPPGQFEIILANINRHVILENMEAFAASLLLGGKLLLSGLLETDGEMIKEAAEKAGFILEETAIKNKWIAMKWTR